MIQKIVITFPCGTTITKNRSNFSKGYKGRICIGMKIKGKRPVKIEITTNVIDYKELYDYLLILHPIQRIVLINGECLITDVL